MNNTKSPKNLTFQLKKKKFGTGAEIELPYFLLPLDTMSGEVKWQRSVGPYFGYRCSTSVVVKSSSSKKMKAGQKYNWSSAKS